MNTDQMLKEAQLAAEASKRSREEFERHRDSLMTQLGARDDANLRASLDLLFTYGYSAGTSGESALAIKETMETFKTQFEKTDARNEARDADEVKRSAAHLAAFQKQNELLDRVAKAVEQLPRIADAIDAFMEDDEEEEEDPVPQPRTRPR